MKAQHTQKATWATLVLVGFGSLGLLAAAVTVIASRTVPEPINWDQHFQEALDLGCDRYAGPPRCQQLYDKEQHALIPASEVVNEIQQARMRHTPAERWFRTTVSHKKQTMPIFCEWLRMEQDAPFTWQCRHDDGSGVITISGAPSTSSGVTIFGTSIVPTRREAP